MTTGVVLIIELISMVAKLVPTVAPLVKQLFDMIKGTDVEIPDITHEELVARVDAAIAQLPPWE